MRRILLLVNLPLFFSLPVISQNWLNYMDVEQVVHPDWLYERWLQSQNYRTQHLFSYKIQDDTSNQLMRYRGLINSSQFAFSALVQPDHLSAGLAIRPDDCPVHFLIGDLQVDFGHGLTFSNRYHFDSWTADPVQRLYRARLPGAGSSSDPDRIIRGGGLLLQQDKIRMSGFFSSGLQGLSAEYVSPDLKTGVLLVESSENEPTSDRLGWYGKLKIPGGILFSEWSVQVNQAWAQETGLCFFGSEHHRFTALFRYWSPNFNPRHNKLTVSSPRTHDFFERKIAYQARMSRGWMFQSEVLSMISYELEEGHDAPLDGFKLRVGLRYEKRDQGFCFVRLGIDPGKVQAMFRGRYEIVPGQYVQFETGVSRYPGRSTSRQINGYLAVDWKYIPVNGRLQMIAGWLLHSAHEGAPLLYRYEPDLLYQMSIPVISGVGKTVYAKLRYQFQSWCIVETKIKQSVSVKNGQKEASVRFQMQLILRPSFVAQSSGWHLPD